MKGFEAHDPFVLVGVGYPVVEEADEETARCIVEEYALAGFGRDEILRLFEAPAYVMPHAILTRRGRGFVTSIIDEVLGGVR